MYLLDTNICIYGVKNSYPALTQKLLADLAMNAPIGPYDIQIAAQGVSRGLTVVTHNMGEFSRVPGLKAEDWII